ncbi:MAG: 50S ribosomal protein L10 [Gemmataceae bacterium]|nr:50S ribosomal protein L10 [Gemmataceae bacterium]
MSKQVKQMQMDVLKGTFKDVRDAVFMSSNGVDAISENTMRLALRKKNIRMQMVKNSLMRRVFADMGVTVPDAVWAGPTVVAWGGDSVKGLSKEIETHLKTDKIKDKLKVKSVLADGASTTFELALKMPTRLEAIGEIVAMAMGPASQIAGCLVGPAGAVASQIATIGEKGVEAPAA